MTPTTCEALKWIAQILNDNNIPYRIGGGSATFLYGSGRAINDIDISVQGKFFETIVPLVKEYITIGPKYYKNDKWDCTTLSLNYHGQDIDLTDVDTLLMKRRDGSGWVKNKDIYEKYPNKIVEVDGVKISLMNPKVLLEYKQELDGEHQEFDRKYLQEYIESHS